MITEEKNKNVNCKLESLKKFFHLCIVFNFVVICCSNFWFPEVGVGNFTTGILLNFTLKHQYFLMITTLERKL